MNIRSPILFPVASLALIGLVLFSIGIRINYTNIDEAYFADPVINYLTGHGYTTTSWDITKQTETHVSTAPAYSLLLLGWLKLFGISQAAVRSLAATVVLVAAFVFWRASCRAGLIKSGAAGVILISVFILDYGFAYSYSVGRPDALSALLVAALFYSYTLANPRLALGLMGGLAILLPLVQWSCVIYVGFLSVALLLIFRGKMVKYVVVVGTGMAVGLLAQKIAYEHFGVWDTWMNTVRAERSESLLKWTGKQITAGALFNRHSNTIPKDFSALLILGGMAWTYGWSKLRRQAGGVQLAKSACVIVGIITAGMYLVGKFPTYYGWMLSLPLAVILASYYEQARTYGRLESRLAVLVAALAAGAGLPLQACMASHDWHDRQLAAMAAWLEPKISQNDVVFCDYPFYYIAKERAGTVFTGHYFRKISEEEFSRLTLAIIGRHGSDWNHSKQPLTNQPVIGQWQPARTGRLGNDWQFGIMSAPNYECTVYRMNTPE